MVLYKRKQVTLVRPPSIPKDLDTEIFVIPQTKEWFLNYDDYLNRMDYYYHRKFVCEITGNSCLTFFEAFESEQKEIKDVEKNFPEALREHLLRFLQFNRITRLDQLVDKVYLVFKSEYFPGEEVYVKNPVTASALNPETPSDEQSLIYVSTIKQRGVIREKVQYSNPLDTKYLVATLNEGRQIIATNEQISRDRNHFTKWLIKTFVKLTVTRSHKVGAPWVVKQKYAKKYRIPNEYPEDLKHFESSTPTGDILYEDEIDLSVTPSPSSESAKGKKQREKQLKKKAALHAAANASSLNGFEDLLSEKDFKAGMKNGSRQRFLINHLPAAILKELKENDLVTLSSFQPSKKTIVDDLMLNFDLQTCRPVPKEIDLPENAKLINQNVAARLRQEIEELEDDTMDIDRDNKKQTDINLEEAESKKRLLKKLETQKFDCIEEALECWTFLNIYHSILKIDTFTFDDFLCAMSWNDEQLQNIGRCELLDEIWCAVLGATLSSEVPKKGTSTDDNILGLQITLPPKGSLFDKSPNDKDAKDSFQGDQKAVNNEKTTGIQAAEDLGSEEKNETPQSEEEDKDTKEEKYSHNAYSVMNYRGVKWYDRLRKRNFKDGNWQTILLGLLSLVEYVPGYQKTIAEVFNTLAPPQNNPNPLTVQHEFYANLSIDLRFQTLRILTSLLVNGSLVREYIDKSLDTCATLRRARLDKIRDVKAAVDKANKIHTSLHEKLIEACNNAGDTKLWAQFNKKKPRLNTKSYEMVEYERELSETDKSFKNLWNERDEAIENIKSLRLSKKEVETKFTEMDCQRVRLLGKDRLFNRYWWFENNGLPNLHFSREADEDDEPEAESDMDDEDKDEVMGETYLMGRLWVQGPSVMDLKINLNLSQEETSSILDGLELLSKEKPTIDTEKIAKGDPQEKTSGGESEAESAFIPVMDFGKLPGHFIEVAKSFKVVYSANSITVDEKEIIDRVGGIPKGEDVTILTPVQRKFIEESPEPLISGTQWRFYDRPEQIEMLAKWLNPWGKRESQLRKELLRVKEGLIGSITKRRKALWLDQLPKDAVEIEDKSKEVGQRLNILKEEKEAKNDDAEKDDSSDDIARRKRQPRRTAYTPNKRQKTAEEILRTGSIDELELLKDELNDRLMKTIADNDTKRVLEWVNSAAQEALDRSLYEGGDKARPRGKRTKK